MLVNIDRMFYCRHNLDIIVLIVIDSGSQMTKNQNNERCGMFTFTYIMDAVC